MNWTSPYWKNIDEAIGNASDLVKEDDFAAEVFEASRTRFVEPAELWFARGAHHWPHREREAEFVERFIPFLSRVDWR